MIGSHRLGNARQLAIGLVGSGLACIAFVGAWIGQNGVDYRSVIVGLLLLAGVATFVAGRQGIAVGLLLWISIFAIGFRTIAITPALALHPLVLFILALLVLQVAEAGLSPQLGIRLRAPAWLWAFSLFWAWAWIIGASNGHAWDLMLSEFLNFVVMVPVFVVVDAITGTGHGWHRVAAALLGVGTLISLLGVLEYYFPGLVRLLPAYVGRDTEFLAEGGFYRATFSFWGSPAATFVSALALPFVWPLWQLWRGALVRVGLAASVAIQILGIYIGGYRSLWGLVGLVFVVLIVWRKGLIGVIISAAGAGLAYQLLPQLGQSRFQTLLSALQGNFQDSSALNRWQRLVGAFTVVIYQPWGLGWGGAGWVHSDFLQVAANLGLLAGVLFLAWYLSTLVRLWRLAAQRPDDALTLGLLGGYMVAGGLLLSQGVEVLPQLALPVWFVWALVEARLRHKPRMIGKPHGA